MTNQTTFASVMQRYIDAGEFTASAIAVSHRGKLVIEHYAGASSPQSLWCLASISKCYTAAMIMRLIEQGTMTLNTRVCDLIPEYTGGGREDIRMRHLLTHTAGMIYESPEMEARLKAHTPMSELIAEAIRTPLQYAPGTRLEYADYHFLFAGEMAARATGKPFAQLVREWVIQPAQLRETFMPNSADEDAAIAARCVPVHAVLAAGTDGAMYNSTYARTLAHPAFGVIASVRDLMHFGQLFSPSGKPIHTRATIAAMTRDQTGGVITGQPAAVRVSEGAHVPWGLAFYVQAPTVPGVFSDLTPDGTFGHGGASGCQLVIDPINDIVMAVTSNTHVLTGRERWRYRLQTIMNAAYASVVG